MKNQRAINKWIKRYLIDGLSGMALGLFATLIVGLILKQIGQVVGNNIIGNLFVAIGRIATIATGVGIGIGVAHTLEVPKLVLYATTVTGWVGAYAGAFAKGTLFVQAGKGVLLSGPGDPVGAFLAAVVGIEIGRLISGKTKLDILITPMLTIISGSMSGILLGPSLSKGMSLLGEFIMRATELQPFWMGMVIAVSMGVFLTLPISSAAISIILGLSGLAAGAATVGCAAQMVGFAVASYRENKINGLLAQGLGTSMLQVPNIIKNPRIWIPPILTSAILGPLATLVFGMQNNSVGAGMGTAGFVGPLMTWQTMSTIEGSMNTAFKIILLHIILPAVFTWVFSEYMRKKEWIRYGDMKIEV